MIVDIDSLNKIYTTIAKENFKHLIELEEHNCEGLKKLKNKIEMPPDWNQKTTEELWAFYHTLVKTEKLERIMSDTLCALINGKDGRKNFEEMSKDTIESMININSKSKILS